jgi:hypothetical protein
MPNPNDKPFSLPDWAEKFRQAPFPVDQLPDAFQSYVRGIASYCGLDHGSSAMVALAVAAGCTPGSWSMPNGYGSPVGLRFNLVVALPPSLTAATLLKEITAGLDARQRESLQRADQIDAAALKMMGAARVFEPPEEMSDTVARGIALADARGRFIASFRSPAFLLWNPAVKVLEAGLRSSADRGILAVFPDLVARLLRSEARREDRALAEMLAHVSEGGQIAASGKGSRASLIQPTFNFVSTTSMESLDRALQGGTVCNRLLEGAIVVKSESQTPVCQEDLNKSSHEWKRRLCSFLESRKELPKKIAWYEPQPSREFQVEVEKWRQTMNNLSTLDFAPMLPFLQSYVNLPIKLAGLFSRISGPGKNDSELFGRALAISKWLSARLLIAIHDARHAEDRDGFVESKERLLKKILEFGPIDFISLRRRFKVQDKAVHQPALEALIEEKRVRLDDNGKLVAA